MNKRSMATWGWLLAIALPLSAGAAIAGSHPAATTQHVDAQHAQLARLAGHWAVRQSMWTDPKAPPVVDHGIAAYAMVLGGRHLRQQLRIASSKPFEGLGYIGTTTPRASTTAVGWTPTSPGSSCPRRLRRGQP